MKFDTSDITSWRRLAATIFPLILPWLTTTVAILLEPDAWRTALAGGITGFIGVMVAWINKSPLKQDPLGALPVPMPPLSMPDPHSISGDLPTPPKALLLLFALAALFTLFAIGGGEACAATSTAAKSKLEITVNANAVALHFDGAVGVGPAICAGYALTDLVHPIACMAIEAAHGDDGWKGHMGPELGLAFPGLELLGLKTAPSVVLGWLLVRIGPGDFFDHAKGAFVLSGSFPFLAF